MDYVSNRSFPVQAASTFPFRLPGGDTGVGCILFACWLLPLGGCTLLACSGVCGFTAFWEAALCLLASVGGSALQLLKPGGASLFPGCTFFGKAHSCFCHFEQLGSRVQQKSHLLGLGCLISWTLYLVYELVWYLYCFVHIVALGFHEKMYDLTAELVAVKWQWRIQQVQPFAACFQYEWRFGWTWYVFVPMVPSYIFSKTQWKHATPEKRNRIGMKSFGRPLAKNLC